MKGVVLAPGTMRLTPTRPNPRAAVSSQLYLLSGEAASAPIQTIEFDAKVVPPLPPAFPNSQSFKLKIFHFNDLHGHLVRFTATGEESILPRIAGKIRSERERVQDEIDSAVLVFSAGDDCTGSIFDEILNDKTQNEPVHPGYRLYSAMGVDAAGLGNHDLDRGLDFLAAAINNNARFPVLAANLTNCHQLEGLCHPAALLVVRGLRIGLVGLVTRAETNLDPDVCEIVHPIPVAQNLIPALRPLCDVLIVISHLGHNLNSPVPMADAGDVELARSLPPGSVDLIIGGHSHMSLNRDGLEPENIVNGIPIVQAGARGEFLGQVDLTIEADSARVTEARLIPVASLPVDRDFQEIEIRPLITELRKIMDRPLGQVEDNPDFATDIICRDFARRELALANFVSDALVERLTRRGFQIDFAMIDASALHCGLPASDTLTYGDCFEIMPYADTLRLYQISGHQLLALINDNTQRIDRPGEPEAERGFLQFSREVRYIIDPESANPLEVTVHNMPIAARYEETFTIVTTSFIRRLAEPWETRQSVGQGSISAGNSSDRVIRPTHFNIHQYPFVETDFLLRSEIVAYIKAHGGVSRQTGARCDGRLRIMGPGNLHLSPQV